MFQEILDARIRDLWNLYEATGEINHGGEKGLLRELFLRRVFEAVLPPHFGVGSGIVVDKWRRQSPQVDLILFDRRRLPPILEENGHGIYPMDAVLRVIEVKSSLDKNGLIQLKKLSDSFNPSNNDGLKMAAVGTLEKGRSYYPFAGLFAYKTSLSSIKKSKANIGGFDDITAPVCVATHNDIGVDPLTLEENVRFFITMILGQIEASARSRKEFSVMEWMF